MTKGQRKAPAPRGKTKKKTKGPTGVATAMKSFIGHLEGTGKAKHTIDAYRFDLRDFADFLQGTRGGKAPLDLRAVYRKDLERYHEELKLDGQKANTRRRKLMTVRKFMYYLTARKKLDLDIAKKLPAPEKIERVPETIDLTQLRAQIATLPAELHLDLRNQALLGLLIDSGCSVSEAAQLRWSMLDFNAGGVNFTGKAERGVKVSTQTLSAFSKVRIAAAQSGTEGSAPDESDLCFVGFNRHGPIRLGKRFSGITPRGIEMLVKGLAEKLGFLRTTPRTLRHSAVVEWYRGGTGVDEIQRRLGLRTPYAFRIYAPIFATIDGAKSKSETTSSA